MDNRIKFTTHFDADHIRQAMDMPNDLMGRVEQVIQLKEEGVRQALIELGWAPPEEVEAMKAQWQAEALEESADAIEPLSYGGSSLRKRAAELRRQAEEDAR